MGKNKQRPKKVQTLREPTEEEQAEAQAILQEVNELHKAVLPRMQALEQQNVPISSLADRVRIDLVLDVIFAGNPTARLEFERAFLQRMDSVMDKLEEQIAAQEGRTPAGLVIPKG